MRQKWKFILSASIRWKKVKSTEWIFAGSCPRPLVSFSLQTPTAMLPNVSVLDALDYLMDGLNFSTFFQSVSKAARWFSLQDAGTSDSKHRQGPEEVPKVIYMRCDNRIMRLDLERINYIEGMGDYVKIFCKDSPKPILSLCSMKYMEEKLPANEFIRVHRSFIVRMDCISAIGRSTLLIEQKDVPIGDAYRERVKGYVSRLAVL
ncbi:LytTR family transcriptional regulator [Bacteroides uniformis]|nr:LytTR family transcriptional regulator [Bacteroides uniformis]